MAKKPSRTILLSEIKRVAKQFPGVEITRDFFRANSNLKDTWNIYWPNFAAFAMAANVKVSAPAVSKVTPLSPSQTIEIAKEKIKVKKEGLEEQVKLLTERNIQLESELSTVASLGERTPQITIITPKVPSGTSESVAFMIGSDWHSEENVDPAAVNYKNEFNLEVADYRILKFWQGQYRMFEILSQYSAIKTVVVGLLGDFISGSIHEDLAESNNLPPSLAIYWVEDRIVSGLKFLLEHLPKDTEIIVVCHSGNHGRMTKKQRGSTEIGNSLEHYMYFHIRDFFKGEDRLKFQIAEGYHSFVRLFDDKYGVRFHHGHAINYAGGVGGITIPINKAVDQWNKAYKVDLDVFGHFHQLMDASNFVVNGSLIGYNDYAIRIKAAYERPQQVFFTVNRKQLSKAVVTPIFLD